MAGNGVAKPKGREPVERPMWDMLRRVAPRCSLHMPAAQGKAPFGRWDPYRMDTTELIITDDLYRPTGAIGKAQSLAARSAGAAHTLMLHGGGTTGIHAMLLYAAKRGDTVILPRNTHISALHACALFGIEPVFPALEYTPLGRPYTTAGAYLHAMEEHPLAKALLVVRPDYYGMMPDLSAIAKAAHKRGMLVLCDEAHGATFNWREDVKNAGACGADLFVQSAHKTLPALTAGAWLHAMNGIDPDRLRRLLRMVQTSSPSFLNMLSLDDARAWMDRHGALACERLGRKLKQFRQTVRALGYESDDDGGLPEGMALDDLRLTLSAPEGGYALAEALQDCGLDVEMADEEGVVIILSLMDGEKRLLTLQKALENASRRRGQDMPPRGDIPRPPRRVPKRVMPVGEAAFGDSRCLPMEEAIGKISATQVGLYPPGVALLVAGERIEGELVCFLKEQRPGRVFGLSGPGHLLCVAETN